MYDGVRYHKTGVILRDLQPASARQGNLFETEEKEQATHHSPAVNTLDKSHKQDQSEKQNRNGIKAINTPTSDSGQV